MTCEPGLVKLGRRCKNIELTSGSFCHVGGHGGNRSSQRDIFGILICKF
jgi:hypothetical protein